MDKFCSNCGHELKEGADICLNCGKILSKNLIPEKKKIPGKGFSIAGMVLGIIACFWSLIDICALEELNSADFTYEVVTLGSAIAYGIGYTLFSLIPSIVGLILSVKGANQAKSSFNNAGKILNIIALCISVLMIAYIIIIY